MSVYADYNRVALGPSGKLHLARPEATDTLCGRRVANDWPADRKAPTCATCRDRWRGVVRYPDGPPPPGERLGPSRERPNARRLNGRRRSGSKRARAVRGWRLA